MGMVLLSTFIFSEFRCRRGLKKKKSELKEGGGKNREEKELRGKKKEKKKKEKKKQYLKVNMILRSNNRLDLSIQYLLQHIHFAITEFVNLSNSEPIGRGKKNMLE